MLVLALSPLPIAACVTAWEIIFRISNALIHQAYRDDDSPSLTKLKTRGGSYMVALIHAMIMTVRGSWHVLQLLDAPSATAKLAIPHNPNEEWYSATAATEPTNVIFFSWLFYDALHVIIAFPKLGGVDTLLHHLGFMGASLVCGTHRILPFAFAWLLAGELSTIPLNIRWILIHSSRSNKSALGMVNLAFAACFFLVRVLGYGLGLVHLLWTLHRDEQGLQTLAHVPPLLLHLVLGLLVGGYVLNLVWFRKIVTMAQRGRGGGGSTGKNRKDQ